MVIKTHQSHVSIVTAYQLYKYRYLTVTVVTGSHKHGDTVSMETSAFHTSTAVFKVEYIYMKKLSHRYGYFSK